MKNPKLLSVVSLFVIGISVSQAQIITTVAGNGYDHGTNLGGYTGNGGQATSAELFGPENLVFDSIGNYYVTDEENDVIRKVDTTGIITTIAGTGTGGFSGNGGPATSAKLTWPRMIILDSVGNIYFSDCVNNSVRKINLTTGIISQIAGTGTGGYNGDNISATTAELYQPNGIALDKKGNLYIAEGDNQRVRKVNGNTGIITTIAGNGVLGFSGNGGQATAAEFHYPYGLALDLVGNIIVCDQFNYCLRKINISTGIISNFAGIPGVSGYTGDGGPATSAELSGSAYGLTADKYSNLYLSDASNNVVRVIKPTGIITTIVGNGALGYSGDGGPATAAEMDLPIACAFDNNGNLYIPDHTNNVIRKVTNVASCVPPDVTLRKESKDTVCVGAGSILLSGSPNGGIFSGYGVYGNYFYPDSALINKFNLVYFKYTDSLGCSNIAEDSIYVTSCEGISTISGNNSELKIYPDPSNGVINYSYSGDLSNGLILKISDLFGRTVKSISLVKPNGNLNFNDDYLNNGIYFYQLINSDDRILNIGKFIIIR